MVQICPSVLILVTIYIWTWSPRKVHVLTVSAWIPNQKEKKPLKILPGHWSLTTSDSIIKKHECTSQLTVQLSKRENKYLHQEFPHDVPRHSGHSKFSKETAVLIICQALRELLNPRSSQFHHQILVHCFQPHQIRIFGKLDFSAITMVKNKHHTKIGVEKETHVAVSNLIPKFEKLYGTQQCPYPISK